MVDVVRIDYSVVDVLPWWATYPPMVGPIIRYEDLNYDPQMRNKMIQYFLDKTMNRFKTHDKWKQLFKYMVVKKSGDKYGVDLTKGDSKEGSEEEQRQKIKFLRHDIINHRFINSVIQ